jgi:hypothetical protein
MSDLLTESVFVVPALSMAAIEAVGEEILTQFQPSALLRPEPVDLLEWVDRQLPRYGIHVSPASFEELGELAGATDPTGEDEIDILIGEEVWEGLLHGGRRANFARATVAHELSHAVLHVPVIRRRLNSPQRAAMLARTERGRIKAFTDPEWQAWALAGCILMPRCTIAMLGAISASAMASIYQVSEAMAHSHLKRLRIEGHPSLF